MQEPRTGLRHSPRLGAFGDLVWSGEPAKEARHVRSAEASLLMGAQDTIVVAGAGAIAGAVAVAVAAAVAVAVAVACAPGTHGRGRGFSTGRR